MAVKQEVSNRIRDLLRDNPRGLNISNMVKSVGINRNTMGKYLDILLISGQVEMHRFGMAKIYTLSRRLPVFSVLSLSSEYVLHVDRNLRVIFLNTPFLDLLGLAEKDVTGKKLDYTSIPAFFEESYPRLLCWINEGLAGVKRRGELVMPAKGLFFSCRVDPAVFFEGQKGVSVIFEDITAKKQDEKRISESEERYRKLVEISPDAIILHRNGIVFYANPAAVSLMGATSADEILGANILDYVQAEYQADVRRTIYDDLSGKQTPAMEVGIFRVDGTPIIIEGRGVRMHVNGEPAIQIVLRDITQRKRTEAALRESEALYRSLAEISQDLIFVIDRDDRVVYVNRTAADFLKTPAGEIIGTQRSANFPKEIAKHQYQHLRQVIETRQPFRCEGTIGEGDAVRWFDHVLLPIQDANGSVTSVLGISRDITQLMVPEERVPGPQEGKS